MKGLQGPRPPKRWPPCESTWYIYPPTHTLYYLVAVFQLLAYPLLSLIAHFHSHTHSYLSLIAPFLSSG